MGSSTEEFPISRIPAAHISTVPLRSPLRYPGGKTWLIPHLEEWLSALPERPEVFVEPFCGGATASLLAIAEDYADKAVMVEKDEAIANFWKYLLEHPNTLCERIENFELNAESVGTALGNQSQEDGDRAFRTLLRNRTSRAGIIANGAALIRAGEKGKGVGSRWYPQTLIKRIHEIQLQSCRFSIECEDGLMRLQDYVGVSSNVIFVDPPYTIGNKQPGRRLYDHNDINHEELFETLSRSKAEFMMTYNADPYVCELVRQHKFSAVRVEVRNAHASTHTELVITRRPHFC